MHLLHTLTWYSECVGLVWLVQERFVTAISWYCVVIVAKWRRCYSLLPLIAVVLEAWRAATHARPTRLSRTRPDHTLKVTHFRFITAHVIDCFLLIESSALWESEFIFLCLHLEHTFLLHSNSIVDHDFVALLNLSQFLSFYFFSYENKINNLFNNKQINIRIMTFN